VHEKQFPTIKSNPMRIPALFLLIAWAGAAAAWDRGHVDTFAVLPDYVPGVPVLP
jgi:hypothetical protein